MLQAGAWGGDKEEAVSPPFPVLSLGWNTVLPISWTAALNLARFGDGLKNQEVLCSFYQFQSRVRVQILQVSKLISK